MDNEVAEKKQNITRTAESINQIAREFARNGLHSLAADFEWMATQLGSDLMTASPQKSAPQDTMVSHRDNE
jgi:hypothetical protein